MVRFHELDAEIVSEHLEDFTGPILLGLRDQVLGGVPAEIPFEVVIGRDDTVDTVFGLRVVVLVVVVEVDVKAVEVIEAEGIEVFGVGEVAMSRLVGRAGPFQPVGLRLDAGRQNDALQRRSEAQPVQVLVGRRVARTRVVTHSNHRSIDLLILVADSQPEVTPPVRMQLLKRHRQRGCSSQGSDLVNRAAAVVGRLFCPVQFRRKRALEVDLLDNLQRRAQPRLDRDRQRAGVGIEDHRFTRRGYFLEDDNYAVHFIASGNGSDQEVVILPLRRDLGHGSADHALGHSQDTQTDRQSAAVVGLIQGGIQRGDERTLVVYRLNDRSRRGSRRIQVDHQPHRVRIEGGKRVIAENVMVDKQDLDIVHRRIRGIHAEREIVV